MEWILQSRTPQATHLLANKAKTTCAFAMSCNSKTVGSRGLRLNGGRWSEEEYRLPTFHSRLEHLRPRVPFSLSSQNHTASRAVQSSNAST